TEAGPSLRRALAVSQNIPAVRLIRRLGPASVVELARRMGISSELGTDLSLALGTSELTLLELTSAYGTFADRGEWVEPHGILEVLDQKGRCLWRPKSRRRAAMSRAGAAIMVDMLRAVVSEGSGGRAKHLPRAVAGKTGTTNEFRDALFVGFSPTLVTGVWVGRDDYRSLGGGQTGSRAALPIWTDFMTHALKTQPPEYFDIPDDVVRVWVDPKTGGRIPEERGGVFALYRKGTEPKPAQKR
ncbi:penicillin-binding transpeptidase domain-containing protein, partial [Thermodesulfobacteriota bacterium]